MSFLQVGRLRLGAPWQWHEAIGDPVTNLGGAAIPAPRQAIRHQITIATNASDDAASDTLNDRLRIRRQLRSMFNNVQLKLQGFMYVQYSDDAEQNGWYVPDFGQLADFQDPGTGLMTGLWKLEQVAWIMAGHLRINREARNIWMKDLRLGAAWRDTLKFLYSADFSWLPGLTITALPPAIAAAANAVNGYRVPLVSMPMGRDGGVCQICAGPRQPPTANAQVTNLSNPDLACIALDRPESSFNTGDVIVYDRRGQITAPTAGPDTEWEEAYGSDYHWGWLS